MNADQILKSKYGAAVDVSGALKSSSPYMSRSSSCLPRFSISIREHITIGTPRRFYRHRSPQVLAFPVASGRAINSRYMSHNSLEASEERVRELTENVESVQGRIDEALKKSGRPKGKRPLLLPISKLKPASDILAVHRSTGLVHFGENYVQELVDKATKSGLPDSIRWHFVGGLQSNKCKILAAIPNLEAIHALDSIKKADLLEKALSTSPTSSSRKIGIFVQINTSREDSKGGLEPLPHSSPSSESTAGEPSSSSKKEKGDDVISLAKHISSSCPHLKFRGLMTIGNWDTSHSKEDATNPDFETLIKTRDELQSVLRESELLGEGEELELSMGMSADFEVAARMGSDLVRVGTDIFGVRPKKEDVKKDKDKGKKQRADGGDHSEDSGSDS